MQISIGITVKAIEVQCATVSEMLNRKLTKSVVNKRKHDDNVNHYTCSTIDSQISTLANDTNDLANVSMVD